MLFHQMAVDIHHSGAGTSAAGFRAGVPSINLTYSIDQIVWGVRAFKLGVGPQPILQKRRTTEALASTICPALKPQILAAASKLGEKIRRERGAENAAEIINQCWE
ncbi:MAG: hypothetical protein C3F13_11390 [Anaerolineales bacterium]|nr:MAG: hypothetical protein C3F13_11390 [Anaerolineales bacterium]